MATWEEMCEDNRLAARELLLSGRYRSSVSRAYYTIYCGVTSIVGETTEFRYGSNNPSHDSMLNLATNNIPNVGEARRRELRKAIRRLQNARIEADYLPSAEVGVQSARDALRDASRILGLLGIENENG